jgi:DNA primase
VAQQWAMAWSVEQLWNTDEGKRIGLSYFHERGFSDATIKAFHLGYVPERQRVRHQLPRPTASTRRSWRRPAGSSAATMGGRPGTSSPGASPSPILGLSGQPIAFGARTLKSDKKLPKYFNSPESVLYVKSRSLYGIHHAKKAIVEQQLCYLVEGYTDVISCIRPASPTWWPAAAPASPRTRCG